jgi:hypothetical protein
MRRRCRDKGFEGYAVYGGRGIKVCNRWHDSFEDFWADMGPSWFPGASIDRMDGDGHYHPANCRWATDVQQANNKRNNAVIDTPWGRMSKSMAARTAGIPWSTLKHRIERGWPQSRWFETKAA